MKKLEKGVEDLTNKTEIDCTKELGKGLIGCSNAFYELFQNGEKAFRNLLSENDELQDILDNKLQDKQDKSKFDGKPQMFRRCESPFASPNTSRKQFAIGESRIRTMGAPSSPRSVSEAQEKQPLNRRRSMRFEKTQVDEHSPRARPLSFQLRISSPDLKSAMLQPLPIRTASDASAPSKALSKIPTTQEEIAFERELENCNDDAYAILLKLILRESFYRKRLGIVIEVNIFIFLQI